MDKYKLSLENVKPNFSEDKFSIMVLYYWSKDHKEWWALDFFKNQSCGFKDYNQFEDILNMFQAEEPLFSYWDIFWDYKDCDDCYDDENNISWQNKEQVLIVKDTSKGCEFNMDISYDDLYGNSINTTYKEFINLISVFVQENYNIILEYKEG